MQFRSNRFNSPEVVKNLVIINVLFLLAKWGFQRIGVDLDEQLGLFFYESNSFKPWQLVTHFFMHANFTHLFFNMFAVYLFGSRLEQVWGGRKFLLFYVVSAFGAFALQTGIQYVEFQQLITQLNYADYQDVFQNGRELLLSGRNWVGVKGDLNALMNVQMVGASGAVFGILAAFAYYFPNTELFLLFFPFPIKAKYMVLGYAVLELYQGVANFEGDNVAHFAHLGGAIFGFILVLIWNKTNRRTFY